MIFYCLSTPRINFIKALCSISLLMYWRAYALSLTLNYQLSFLSRPVFLNLWVVENDLSQGSQKAIRKRSYLQLMTVAKLQLGSCNEHNFIVGGDCNMGNGIKVSAVLWSVRTPGLGRIWDWLLADMHGPFHCFSSVFPKGTHTGTQ